MTTPLEGRDEGRPDRMSETEKPFTVSDRRHFTPDGRVREEAEPEEPSSPPAEESAPPATSESAPSPEPGPEPEPPPSGEASGPVDLTQFLLSLGAQASMMLTGQGLPEGAEPDPKAALEAARSYISILEMLHEKTKGNRTESEDKVLDGLLYELRMAYVEMSRAGGS